MNNYILHDPESYVHRCSVKNLSWKIAQNSQEIYPLESFLNTVAGLEPLVHEKRGSWKVLFCEFLGESLWQSWTKTITRRFINQASWD